MGIINTVDMRFKLTEEHKTYIVANYDKMSRKKMADNLSIGVTPINTFMQKKGLKISKSQSEKFRIEAMTGRTTFTKKDDDYIKENYLKLPIKTIAKNINRSDTGIMGRLKHMKLEIPKELREQRKRQGMYRKGHAPVNKGKKQTEYMSPKAIERTKGTRFKKDHIPLNAFEKDGVITIRTDHKNRHGRNYKYIRIALGKWLPLHKHLWEQENGKIPKGHCLWFIDGDSMNCTLKNIELITRAENVRRNHSNFLSYPPEISSLIQLKNKLQKTLKNGK